MSGRVVGYSTEICSSIEPKRLNSIFHSGSSVADLCKNETTFLLELFG